LTGFADYIPYVISIIVALLPYFRIESVETPRNKVLTALGLVYPNLDKFTDVLWNPEEHFLVNPNVKNKIVMFVFVSLFPIVIVAFITVKTLVSTDANAVLGWLIVFIFIFFGLSELLRYYFPLSSQNLNLTAPRKTWLAVNFMIRQIPFYTAFVFLIFGVGVFLNFSYFESQFGETVITTVLILGLTYANFMSNRRMLRKVENDLFTNEFRLNSPIVSITFRNRREHNTNTMNGFLTNISDSLVLRTRNGSEVINWSDIIRIGASNYA